MPIEMWGRYKLQGADVRSVYDDGFLVRTPLGAVIVHRWDEKFGKGMMYEAIIGGRAVYGREDGVYRTKTGAAIVAHRWLKTLAEPIGEDGR